MNPIWTTCFIEPIPIRENPSLELSDYIRSCKLTFQLEFDGKYLPIPDWGEHNYRYRCMSCYLASGDDEFSFTTEYAQAKDLKDGPTVTQQAQMANHTRQHQIMLQWAKGWLK